MFRREHSEHFLAGSVHSLLQFYPVSSYFDVDLTDSFPGCSGVVQPYFLILSHISQPAENQLVFYCSLSTHLPSSKSCLKQA